jgi:glycosyltransferase involved in cell wall biosynthesis
VVTFGISMVRDEADVIAGTLRHMADEVDHLIVADNRSTDGTRDILSNLARDLPLTVLDDPEIGYLQSKKMTHLAGVAADAGAVWIVPFDADELWVWDDRIRDHLHRLTATVVRADLYNHFPSAVDPDDPDPFRSIVWRQRQPGALPKVAFRWHPAAVIHQGNHGIDLPTVTAASGMVVRHFPYRSADQFVRKARNGAEAYRATDFGPEVGAHWRQYGDLLDRFGPSALEDVFRRWFWNLSPVDAGLVHDPAPYLRWQ